ncbi:hypothetical protein [Gluconobacter kondonii]|uniref:hypothetical protein n=1 Tax=Gluconobacter kondonii TaxID=941463 RepID=UPI001B8C18AE|nr:hypothetical protein [Gluconobacter kondonii]MBS1083260.1 hypothetical protein [Gluconobacter kondonii]
MIRKESPKLLKDNYHDFLQRIRINEFFLKNGTIIAIISGIGHENDSDKYILLEDDFIDSNLLGITSRKRDFFINDSTKLAIDFLKDFSEVIVITHSMGGFFGFYLNKYIEIDLCIVCSPYFSLSSEEMDLSDTIIGYYRRG